MEDAFSAHESAGPVTEPGHRPRARRPVPVSRARRPAHAPGWISGGRTRPRGRDPVPDGSAGPSAAQVREYFTAGVRLAWVIDPATRMVHMHGGQGEFRSLAAGDVLAGDDALPGFALPVDEGFE